jgi:hypothetical protein
MKEYLLSNQISDRSDELVSEPLRHLCDIKRLAPRLKREKRRITT